MTTGQPSAPAHTATSDHPPHRYNAALANQIEAHWQEHWEKAGTWRQPGPGEAGFDPSRPKKYILDMFPYPSGVGLHVGHPLGYIATDIYARYLRMTGHNVLYTMGFDAFGLPAEQYALATNTHPRITTEANVATMRRQLRRLGLSHDPQRSVSTTDEDFYKWTQWIFLRIYHSWYDDEGDRARPIADLIKMLESGERKARDGRVWSTMSEVDKGAELDRHRLAYLAEVPVNWCPQLGTVLANEEVTAEGRSERGNFPVFKRPLKQWMLRITAYADRLLADLDGVDWPESVKNLQRHWIGRSEGAFIDFPCGTRRVRVFTTRPDTVYGATYLVLSPGHPMVDALATEKYGETKFIKGVFPGADDLLKRGATPRELIAAYRAYAGTAQGEGEVADQEKTGVFIGAYAVNPLSGARLPVYIADYVLMTYGTGAIMAVPGQDQRDWDFAEALNLPIVRTVQVPAGFEGRAYTGEGPAINSGMLDGLDIAAAKSRIIAHLERQGLGQGTVQYKLRDWLFSRQRYWGEPFPIVFDERGLAYALPESMLPVTLPPMENFQPEASDDPDAPPRPPLARAGDWVRVTLDLGDGRGPRAFTRETNTMPNWAGSCWYYLRYLDPKNARALVDPGIERYWMGERGVDLYVGGVEHAVLHLLYARFWHKVLLDLNFVGTPEPFARLFNQGYIQAAAYTDARGVYVEAEEVVEGDEVQVPVGDLESSAGVHEAVVRATRFTHQGRPVFQEYGKMGKSLRNAVTPDEVCAAYGGDTLRVYEMSMGPLEASKPWNTRDIGGAYRFLQRLWRNLIDEQTGAPRVGEAPVAPAMLRRLHKTILGVRRDFETLGFNTAVSKLIELNNEVTKGAGDGAGVPRALAEALVLMLAPLAPHMAEELWRRLGHPESLAFAPFPAGDAALAADDEVEVPVQVAGKVRGRVRVPAGADAKACEAAALADADVQRWIEGRPVRRVIVVPGKMVNVVL